MYSRGDPLDRYLMSSERTRQCDSLGFITHEDSGISLKSSIYCTKVLSPVMRDCGLEMKFNKDLILFTRLSPLLQRISLNLCHFLLTK